MVDTFYPDVSEFQNRLDGSYSRELLCFRLDSGYRTDNHAVANWAAAEAMLATGKLRVAIGYVVYIPGQEAAILARVRALIGAHPPARFVAMIDMESGKGFAGGGDHSAGANGLAGQLAAWTGSWARVWPYANSYDYGSTWPHMDARLSGHRITAAYSDRDPGTYGWQYYGGVPNPMPAGYPTASAPFGRCDHNVIHRSTAQIETDIGVTAPKPKDWFDMATQADLRAAVKAELTAMFGGNPMWSPDGKPHGFVTLVQVAIARGAMDAIRNAAGKVILKARGAK